MTLPSSGMYFQGALSEEVFFVKANHGKAGVIHLCLIDAVSSFVKILNNEIYVSHEEWPAFVREHRLAQYTPAFQWS